MIFPDPAHEKGPRIVALSFSRRGKEGVLVTRWEGTVGDGKDCMQTFTGITFWEAVDLYQKLLKEHANAD
jgi:hypothetical protein